MLSHELRNPLGAVVSATAMLKTPDANPETHMRSIDVLERQSRQMARLLDDLLDASRVTQNKIELRRRVIDLRLIASEAADAVRPQARERGRELKLDLAEQPLWVRGDVTRLQQIQINLLSNAIKYTPRGVVVADNADSLEMLCSMLKLAGASCHSASDGRSALALVDTSHSQFPSGQPALSNSPRTSRTQ